MINIKEKIFEKNKDIIIELNKLNFHIIHGSAIVDIVEHMNNLHKLLEKRFSDDYEFFQNNVPIDFEYIKKDVLNYLFINSKRMLEANRVLNYSEFMLYKHKIEQMINE